MKKLILIATLITAGGLVGCGGSVCARNASLAKNACAPPNGAPAVTFDAKKCEAKVSGCTAADTVKLDKAFDCMEVLGKCSDAAAYGPKVLGCWTDNTSGLSAACLDAIAAGSQ